MAAARPRLGDAAFVGIPLALDLVSKFVALWSLPVGQPIQRDAALQFVLRLNPTGLGSWAQRVLAGQRPQMLLVSAAVFAGLTVALIAVKRTRLAPVGKVLVCIAAALGPALVMGPLMYLSAAWSVRAVLVVLGLSRVALLLTIWALLGPSLWKHAVGLISATALGNLASLVLPPFAVVNFMYSEPMWGSACSASPTLPTSRASACSWSPRFGHSSGCSCQLESRVCRPARTMTSAANALTMVADLRARSVSGRRSRTVFREPGSSQRMRAIAPPS